MVWDSLPMRFTASTSTLYCLLPSEYRDGQRLYTAVTEAIFLAFCG